MKEEGRNATQRQSENTICSFRLLRALPLLRVLCEQQSNPRVSNACQVWGSSRLTPFSALPVRGLLPYCIQQQRSDRWRAGGLRRSVLIQRGKHSARVDSGSCHGPSLLAWRGSAVAGAGRRISCSDGDSEKNRVQQRSRTRTPLTQNSS